MPLTLTERARLGGLRRCELYGNPGTSEGRSKGGRNASEFFRLHPQIARQRGLTLRKEIKNPPRSIDLASFFGIMLGDGSIRSKYQCTISFNYKTDCEHAEYATKLIERLFGVSRIIHIRKNSLGADIVVSSASVVGFLLKHGLKSGNKITNQVDIPEWIKRNREFRKSCVRGLFDTDGSIYVHRYKVSNKWYSYLKMNFTSCSRPLLRSVRAILADFGIKAPIHGHNLYINSKDGVNTYCRVIGTSNKKFIYRWQRF